MADFKIRITQRAFSDITECVLFANNVSNEAATRLREEIIASIASLKTYPNAYPDIGGLTVGKAKIKRMPVHHGRYLILYKVEGEQVTIYDVIDSRKDSSILKL